MLTKALTLFRKNRKLHDVPPLPLPYKHKNLMITAVLHRGGGAWLYHAEDSKGRKYVLKEYCPREVVYREGRRLHVADAAQKEFIQIGLQRFILEGRFLDILNSPRFPRVIKAFQAHNTAYLVFKKLPGFTLNKWSMRLKGSLIPEPVILHYLKELLDSLDVIHRYNLVHLDIHPSNLMLHKGQLFIIDFGSVQHVLASVETQTQWRTYTPGFTAPEMKESRQVSFAADYYSIGACLRFMGVEAGKGYSPALLRFVRSCLDDDPVLRPTNSNSPLVRALF